MEICVVKMFLYCEKEVTLKGAFEGRQEKKSLSNRDKTRLRDATRQIQDGTNSYIHVDVVCFSFSHDEILYVSGEINYTCVCAEKGSFENFRITQKR